MPPDYKKPQWVLDAESFRQKNPHIFLEDEGNHRQSIETALSLGKCGSTRKGRRSAFWRLYVLCIPVSILSWRDLKRKDVKAIIAL